MKPVAPGDRVWYKDYSGVLVAIVADAPQGGRKFASLSVLTRSGVWLGRPDSPRYDASQYGMPPDGVWAVDRDELL